METTKIAVKIHKIGKEVLLAACDETLLGKTAKGTNFDITIKRDFYLDLLVTKDEFIKLLDECTSANVIGKSATDHMVEKGVIDKDSVAVVCGLPHVHIYYA